MRLETNCSASDFKYWLTQSCYGSSQFTQGKKVITVKAYKSKQSVWQMKSEEHSKIIPRFQELGEGCQSFQRSEFHGKNPPKLSYKSQKSDNCFQQRNEGQGWVLNQAAVSCHYSRDLSLFGNLSALLFTALLSSPLYSPHLLYLQNASPGGLMSFFSDCSSCSCDTYIWLLLYDSCVSWGWNSTVSAETSSSKLESVSEFVPQYIYSTITY